MRSSFNIIFTLAAIFIIAFGGVYYLYVFQPLREKTTALTADTQHRSNRLIELEAATANIADLGEEIDKLSGAIADFEQKLPEQREVEIVLKKVWELASRNSLVPKSVRTEPAENKGRFSHQSIQMTITGDFDGFYAFMLEIERLNRITRMPTIKIKKIQNDVEGLMQADVVLQIFFEPNRAGANSPAKTADSHTDPAHGRDIAGASS